MLNSISQHLHRLLHAQLLPGMGVQFLLGRKQYRWLLLGPNWIEQLQCCLHRAQLVKLLW